VVGWGNRLERSEKKRKNETPWLCMSRNIVFNGNKLKKNGGLMEGFLFSQLI